MDSNQDDGSNAKEALTDNILDSLGETENENHNANKANDDSHNGDENDRDPLYVQKRLKQQRRAHEREIREMQTRMQQMQSQYQSSNDTNINLQGGSPGNVQGNQNNLADAISQAANLVLRQKEMEEQKVKQAQAQQHLVKKYQELQDHLDDMSDKYDDFDKVVRNNDVPFTNSMRDAALALPKKGPGAAGEVLYQLGKDRDTLDRISRLPSVDQAQELIALSHALTAKGNDKSANPMNRPIGNIKANPTVNSQGVTDKTPPSAIRALMKAGKFR